MATLKDIAGRAGTTVSTVSRALNGHPDIAEKTRLLINRIADELEYHSPSSARALTGKPSKLIGIIVPEITSSFFSSIFTHVEALLKTRGYSPIFCLSEFSFEEVLKGLDILCRQRVDGIILAHAIDLDIGGHIKKIWDVYRIPVVLAWANAYSGNDCVLIDDYTGINAAVTHLIQRGYGNYAYIGDRVTQSFRYGAFEKAMKQNGLSLKKTFVFNSDVRNEEGGYQGMKKLLDTVKPPVAVITAYDLMAIGAMRAVKEAKLRVPEDCAIVGYDNISQGAYLCPSLSTIAPPIFSMAKMSVDLIISRLENPGDHKAHHVTITTEFIARETT
jgi:LacI family transcriptional regulator